MNKQHDQGRSTATSHLTVAYKAAAHLTLASQPLTPGLPAFSLTLMSLC